jgi:hypothetical protein
VSDSSTPVQTATKAFSVVANTPMTVAATGNLTLIQYTSQGASVSINGGVPPFKTSFDPSCLPAGMKPPGGVVSGNVAAGTPLVTGTYTCNVMVQDSYAPPETASQVLTITVNAAPLRAATTLPSWLLLNRSVSGRVVGAGGVPPYVFTLLGGFLPAGMSFDSSTGQFSGTPTADGSYVVNVQVADSGNPKQTAFAISNLTVAQPLGRNDTPATATAAPNYLVFNTGGSISPYIDPPNGTPSAADQDYYKLQSLSGAIVHASTTTFQPNPLDTVLEIADGNGHAFSTCRQPGDTSMNFTSVCVNDDASSRTLDSQIDFQVPGAGNAMQTFYVHVLDWRGDARPDMHYSLSVSGTVSQLQVTGPTSLSGKVGQGWLSGLAAAGGTGNYSWSVVSGTLPPGMTLTSSGLLQLQGTFSTTGTWVFAVQAADAGPPLQTAQATITFTVTN